MEMRGRKSFVWSLTKLAQTVLSVSSSIQPSPNLVSLCQIPRLPVAQRDIPLSQLQLAISNNWHVPNAFASPEAEISVISNILFVELSVSCCQQWASTSERTMTNFDIHFRRDCEFISVLNKTFTSLARWNPAQTSKSVRRWAFRTFFPLSTDWFATNNENSKQIDRNATENFVKRLSI